MDYIGIMFFIFMYMGLLSVFIAYHANEEGSIKVSRTFFIIGMVLLVLSLVSLIITGVVLFLL